MSSSPGWGPAPPTRWTPPLSEDYTTDADWFLPIARRALAVADPNFTDLEGWQVELIRRVLETFPPGHPRAGQLRWRSVVISLGRQNGKSILGMLLALYALLKNPLTGLVIGIASTADQARIIYKRTFDLINLNPALSRRFSKLTETRGIGTTQGATFEIKASKSAALQGLALSLGVVDELHLLKAELWNALVSGTGARPNTLVVGITTAGDESSELLIQLYETGEKALAGDPELDRFGFFVWEAPEAVVPEDRGELVTYLKAANPSLASGRMAEDIKLADIATLPESEIIRYHLNRFTSGTASFISLGDWQKCARPLGQVFPKDAGPVVFSVDISPSKGYATITANVLDREGYIHTEVVRSMVDPSLEQIVAACGALYARSPITFVCDSFNGKDLARELITRGLPVTMITPSDVANASSTAYALIKQNKVRHSSDPLLSLQIPRAIRKSYGDGFRISRPDSSIEIDALMATVSGIYVAETRREVPVQVF